MITPTTTTSPQVAAARPYSFPSLPQPGQAITFQGVHGLETGYVTGFKHVETPAHQPFNRWGVFVETEHGPAYVNDYRVLPAGGGA